MKSNPLVSILIPTYNSEKYLAEAVSSAFAQTYKNIEIIVHDDASTDNTPGVLALYHDPLLRIIRTQKNHGMIGGWNYIVGKAKGEYIKFLASDDMLAPNCVTELVNCAIAHPNAAIITCGRKFVGEDGKLIKTIGFAKKDMVVDGPQHAHWILTTLRENKIGEPTAVLYPSKLIKQTTGYDPQFSQFADFEYWIRLLQFGDLVYVHKPLCSFRLHASSNTSSAMRDGRFITEIFSLVNKYYKVPYLVTYGLTLADRQKVIHTKTLDILKNIKDLLLSGHLRRASRYSAKLAMAVGGRVIHHQ